VAAAGSEPGVLGSEVGVLARLWSTSVGSPGTSGRPPASRGSDSPGRRCPSSSNREEIGALELTPARSRDRQRRGRLLPGTSQVDSQAPSRPHGRLDRTAPVSQGRQRRHSKPFTEPLDRRPRMPPQPHRLIVRSVQGEPDARLGRLRAPRPGKSRLPATNRPSGRSNEAAPPYLASVGGALATRPRREPEPSSASARSPEDP